MHVLNFVRELDPRLQVFCLRYISFVSRLNTHLQNREDFKTRKGHPSEILITPSRGLSPRCSPVVPRRLG